MQDLLSNSVGGADNMCQQEVLANHAFGDLERQADLAAAQSGLQLQTQCFSDLSHRDSIGWHRLGPQKQQA